MNFFFFLSKRRCKVMKKFKNVSLKCKTRVKYCKRNLPMMSEECVKMRKNCQKAACAQRARKYLKKNKLQIYYSYITTRLRKTDTRCFASNYNIVHINSENFLINDKICVNKIEDHTWFYRVNGRFTNVIFNFIHIDFIVLMRDFENISTYFSSRYCPLFFLSF